MNVNKIFNPIALGIFCLLPSIASAQTTEELLERIEKLEQRTDSQVSSLRRSLTNQAEKVSINGFLSAGATYAEDDVGGDYGLQNQWTFTSDSKMGLQFLYKVGDKTDVTLQLLARARTTDDSWELGAEWAYLSHRFTDELTARIGRMRIPLYMFSENLDVGFTYPWARPPINVYTTLISAYDGADATYKFNTGPVFHQLNAFVGGAAPHSSQDTRASSESWGAGFTSSWKDFTFRWQTFSIDIDAEADISRLVVAPIEYMPVLAANFGVDTTSACATRLDAQVPPPFTINEACVFQLEYTAQIEDTIDYQAFGLQYDNGQYFAMAEHTVSETETASFLLDQHTGYLTVGARFGRYTPYATQTYLYTVNEDDFNFNDPMVVGRPDSAKSRAVGLRAELTSATSVTFEVEHFYDFEDPSPNIMGSMGGVGRFATPATAFGGETNVYSIIFDAVF